MRLETGHSDKVIDRFLEDAVDEGDWQRRCDLVMAAVAAIIDGTWRQLYKHRDELVIPGAVVMKIATDCWLVWRVNLEAPGIVQLLQFRSTP